MKKILGLTVVAILVMALVGGGTWAYFSDVETSSNNVFSAGTLDLGLSNTSNTSSTGSVTGTFSASTWAPGQTQSASLWINNDGSLAMSSVNITITTTVDTSGRPSTISGSPWTSDPYDYFAKEIKITAATFESSNVTGLINETLYSINGTQISLGSLAAGTQKELALTFKFLEDATNGTQGNTANMTISVTGNQ